MGSNLQGALTKGSVDGHEGRRWKRNAREAYQDKMDDPLRRDSGHP